MNYVSLLEQINNHITVSLTANDADPTYRKLAYTKQVVGAANEIGAYYKLDEKDSFIVVAASWFQNINYYIAADDKLQRAENAAAFLKEKGLDDETIHLVYQCILAVPMPQSALNLNEQIVCDAFYYYLGTDDFSERNKGLRKEAEVKRGVKIEKGEWKKSAINLLETHVYQTDYCRLLLQNKKAENLAALKKKEEEKQINALLPSPDIAMPKLIKDESADKIKKEKKAKKPDKGIETMFRIGSIKQQKLSDMADNKAHILITTTSIIISLLISLMAKTLENSSHLVLPAVMLLSVCLITMVLGILVTRPMILKGKFIIKDVESQRTNLLFFGNFFQMSFKDYDKGIKEMMKDREILYGGLTQDIYAQGLVLGRKYHLLRIAYNVFMYGIVASVLVFMVAFFFFAH